DGGDARMIRTLSPCRYDYSDNNDDYDAGGSSEHGSRFLERTNQPTKNNPLPHQSILEKMQHQQFNSSFVFPPETVVQSPVVLNSGEESHDFPQRKNVSKNFTFTCPSGVPLGVSPNVPMSMPPNVPLNMFSMDNTQATQVSQIISPAPSSPLSILEYRDSPTADELDIPEFFQYSKEKYESQKIGCRRRRKSSRDDHFDTSSLDGGDDVEDTNSTMSHAEFRRQIHIQSEQKRRAEIKDGFEELRRHLPTTYTGRKMSKAVLLQKAVSHLKNQSRKESFLLDEISRLNQACVYLTAELEKEK
ncbi:16836_t:CDS:2, partial [Acaulospora morrowiae]